MIKSDEIVSFIYTVDQDILYTAKKDYPILSLSVWLTPGIDTIQGNWCTHVDHLLWLIKCVPQPIIIQIFIDKHIRNIAVHNFLSQSLRAVKETPIIVLSFVYLPQGTTPPYLSIIIIDSRVWQMFYT